MKIRRTEPPAGRRAAIGARRGPKGQWGRRGVPRGSEYQSCTDMGQSSDPLDDYKLRAALEGTHFFSAKTKIPQNTTYFLSLLQLAKRLCPFKLYRNALQGGMVDFKSYFTNAKTHHDEATQVTDLSPDLTTCDTERRSLAHPPSGSRPQG